MTSLSDEQIKQAANAMQAGGVPGAGMPGMGGMGGMPGMGNMAAAKQQLEMMQKNPDMLKQVLCVRVTCQWQGAMCESHVSVARCHV